MKAKTLGVVAVLLVLGCAPAHADKAVKCPYKTLGSCPKIGCAKPGTPLAATNWAKRTAHIHGNPAEISFADLKNLQDDIAAKFANGPVVIKGQKVSSYHNMKAAPRKILLSGLKSGNKSFSEGDYVELSGFIALKKLPPHPNTGESVNCNLTKAPDNDYHINITPAKDSDETEGVVVEMIPQNPHRKNETWDLNKLEAIQEKQLPVKVRGRLFFDSQHRPNTKKTGNAGGNPRRFSLWEIHPLSSFFVCPSGKCSGATGWVALQKWEPKSE